jgi:hypothetical protein
VVDALGAASITFSGSGTATAIGHMEGNISPFSELSPESLADAILRRNLAGGSDGGRTVRDALRVGRNRVSIVGSTLTVYEEDDTTVAWTAALSTGPRDPLSQVDPT